MVSSQLRSDVVDLVREAGRATMTYYDAPESAGVREKDDRSPVTLADEVAHGILVAGLRRLDPSTPVVSEEAAADETEPASAHCRQPAIMSMRSARGCSKSSTASGIGSAPSTGSGARSHGRCLFRSVYHTRIPPAAP